VPSIHDLKHDLPAVCDEVIVRAMAKDADERYQTAGELAKAFSSQVDVKPESWPAEAAVQDEIPSTLSKAQKKHPLPPKERRALETLQPDADMQVSPGAVPHIAEPVVPGIEAKRKRLPAWVVIGGLLAVLLLVGGVGGTMIKRSQDAQATQTVVAMAAAEMRSVAETETARPTETPTATVTHTPSPTMTPTLSPGSTLVSEVDGMVMVYVPEGSFLMGSNAEELDYAIDICKEYSGYGWRTWFSQEIPQHEVYLDAFWIDKTEVTNAMYAVFLNEMGNQSEGGVTWLHMDDNDVRIGKDNGNCQPHSGYADHPVVEVRWSGAAAYCEWAGRRLPTEAEWEKAARGDDGRIYPWGNTDPTCSLAQYSECGGRTVPAGSYPAGASPYGALDMAGNVWEWVADWWNFYYYDTSPGSNPIGPETGIPRVMRGGSWYENPSYIRSAYRTRLQPVISQEYLGFRCARSQ
jgi:formylglycine-generating enzyme required for sulfatase activity